MSRPPHARQAVLAAAEAIVKHSGAANLTYDELVRTSGITRGGIVYHFPTKEALLQALVENDLQQWRDCIASKRHALGAAGPGADLLAYLQSNTEPDEDSARLCAGLLSASSIDKTLNGPWQHHYAEHHRQVVKTHPDPTMAALLTLAADGLFWQEMLGLSALSKAERERVVQRMLELARAGGDAPVKAQAKTVPQSGPKPRARPTAKRPSQR
jgi:AcrR family transcriptional regulator